MNISDPVFWLKALEVALISSVKFLLAPFEAERQGFDMMQSFIITTIGGFIGITAFIFAGKYIFSFWIHFLAMIKSVFLNKKSSEIEKKMPKEVKSERKIIQWVRKRFGLIGIAFITPCIISIPIGTLVAVGLYKSRGRILLFTTLSLIFWSLILNYVAQFLALSQYLPFG